MRHLFGDTVPHVYDMGAYFRPVIAIPENLHNISGEKLYNFIIYFYDMSRRQEEFDNTFQYKKPSALKYIYRKYMCEWDSMSTSSPDAPLRTLEPICIEQFRGVIGILDKLYTSRTHDTEAFDTSLTEPLQAITPTSSAP